jgi:acetyl-CoA carboxylase/biotin carboxylase 1
MPSSAADAAYEAWVKKCGGSRVIRSILVANNGMAATKFIMSIRSFLWQTFGDDQLIHIIAMATPEDMKASAKHLALANAYYEVPGGPNFNNYANVSVITTMAQLHSCDAVWPGWGHASENPALPRTCEEMGIVFIGPTDKAMFLLGDKIASTIIAQVSRSPLMYPSGCLRHTPLVRLLPAS